MQSTESKFVTFTLGQYQQILHSFICYGVVEKNQKIKIRVTNPGGAGSDSIREAGHGTIPTNDDVGEDGLNEVQGDGDDGEYG